MRKTKLEWCYMILGRVLKYANQHKFQVGVLVISLSLTLFLRYAAPQFILVLNAWTNSLISIIHSVKCL